MAITTKDSKASKVAVTQEAPPQEATIVLELAAYQRYHTGGVLYSAGVAYEFPQAEGLEKLQDVEDNGRPMWRVYKPKQAPTVEVQEPVKVVKAPKAKASPVASETAPKATRIEVGSDEELKAAGIATGGAEEEGVEV